MIIQWLGHACFAIQLQTGTTIITDPFDQSIGYPLPNLAADYITISHQHYDHNAVKTILGEPVIIEKEGQYNFTEVNIVGIPSFHDSDGGKKRGKNIIYIIEAEGLRLCHLGDLGHVLTLEQVKAIGDIDVLFVPVGGYFTIDHNQAAKIVEQLGPKCVIPMHYKTEYIDFPISGADEFLRHYPGYEKTQAFSITGKDLDLIPKVVLLELKK